MNKKMKAVSLILAFSTAFSSLNGCGANGKESEKIRIGMGLYRTDDTFISNLTSQFEKDAKEYEKETGIKIILDIQGAKGSQSTQNRQVERFLSLGCDVLLINPVDRMSVSNIIDQAMDQETPIIFFNRQPAEEDLNRWDKLYYVGIDARETAQLQGEIVLEHYKEHPELFDENGDGSVSYVLLEGESSHQDSLIRTEVSIQTIIDGGMPIERLTGGIGNWERGQGAALMGQWLKEFPDQIELVISNNDDMALGAIDTLEKETISNIEVVGIDATETGLEAVKAGKMIGTVASNIELYSDTIFRMATELATSRSVPKDIDLEKGKYFWCEQKIINKEDYQP